MKKPTSDKLLAVLIIAGFFYTSGALAQETGLFYQANTAYKEGKYELAIENYEKLIASGVESGALYYNLGNSYFKKGKLGLAVLNYERAKLFIPNDSDLKSNYDYVLSSLNLGTQPFGNRFERLVDRIFEGLTINSLTILLSLIYVLAIAILILKLFLNGAKRVLTALLFILIVLFGLAAVSLRSKITELNAGAIVISKEADVKFEPLDTATAYFKLSEGSKVVVIETTDNWYKIKRPDSKIGWLNKSALGNIGSQ